MLQWQCRTRKPRGRRLPGARNRKPFVLLLESLHIIPGVHGSHALLKYKQRECVSRARILDYPSGRVLPFARDRERDREPNVDGNLQGTQKFHMRKRPETGFSTDRDPR